MIDNKKNMKTQNTKKINKEKLLELEIKIEEAANNAINKVEEILRLVYESVLGSENKITGKIRKASLKDIEELLEFYLTCYQAASSGKTKDLKELSNLKIKTILVNYMDRRLRNLLIKYHEIVYMK